MNCCDQCGKPCHDGGRVIEGERYCAECLDGIEVITPGCDDENLFDLGDLDE